MEFEVCSDTCLLQAGKLEFILKNYYPSSPIQLKFAVHVKVIELYYGMNQLDPSSKIVYTNVLQYQLQKYSDIKMTDIFILAINATDT